MAGRRLNSSRRHAGLICIAGALVHEQGLGKFSPSAVLSSDPFGHRHTEAGHLVQDQDTYPCLDALSRQTPSPQPPADDPLVSGDGGLYQSSSVVARGLLPSHPAMTLNRVDVAVPLAQEIELPGPRGGMTTLGKG